jgi:6-phosphogluconolactonase
VERTAEEATTTAATLLKTIVCEAVSQRGACHVALAGGTTPHALYQKLAAEGASGEVPWRSMEVFFGDERDVGQDNVESNYRMVQRTLLDHVPIEPTKVYPMRGDAEDLQAAASEYEQAIRRLLPAGAGGLPRFDLILLGMGGDGHTASLFPGSEALNEGKKLVTSHYVPVLGRRRLTFTFPLVNAARNILLLVTGEDKAKAVLGILTDDQESRQLLPAGRIAPTDGILYVILDAAAARLTGLTHA